MPRRAEQQRKGPLPAPRGGATAANQFEGGYDADGKGLSVPDIMMGGTKDTPRVVTPSGVREGAYYPSHEAIDFSDHTLYMNGNVALRAGGDLWMQMMSGSISDGSGSADYLLALRTSTKRALYAYLNARVANIDYVEATGNTSALRPTITGTTNPLTIAARVISVLSTALIALAVWRLAVGIKLKREQKATAA